MNSATNPMLPINTRPAKRSTNTGRSSVEELRNATSWMGNTLTDYCACANDRERAQWIDRAERVKAHVVAMPYCARATESDRDACERMVQRLDAEIERVAKILAERPAQKAPIHPALLRLVARL